MHACMHTSPMSYWNPATGLASSGSQPHETSRSVARLRPVLRFSPRPRTESPSFWMLLARDLSLLIVFCCMRGMCCAPWRADRKAERRVAALPLAGAAARGRRMPRAGSPPGERGGARVARRGAGWLLGWAPVTTQRGQAACMRVCVLEGS